MLRPARAGVIAVLSACAACALSSGCTAKKPNNWKYPPPVFDTPRPSRPLATRPAPPRPAPRQSAPGEPGWLPPGGIKSRWTDIILHHSASSKGGAVSFDRYHRTVQKWDELGYHFVIGNGTDTRDGQVEVGARWTKQKHGAHCKTADNYYNEHGIGICLVGDFDRTPPTRAQLASLDRLLRFLTDQCKVPSSRVRTHGGVTSKTKCPGKHFPLAQVQRSLNASSRFASTQ